MEKVIILSVLSGGQTTESEKEEGGKGGRLSVAGKINLLGHWTRKNFLDAEEFS